MYAGLEFMTFGFRKANYFGGLCSNVKIRRLVRAKSKGQDIGERIQLSSDEIEFGMSGAPILDFGKQLRNRDFFWSIPWQGKSG